MIGILGGTIVPDQATVVLTLDDLWQWGHKHTHMIMVSLLENCVMQRPIQEIWQLASFELGIVAPD